jgi:hypothetical protein
MACTKNQSLLVRTEGTIVRSLEVVETGCSLVPPTVMRCEL